MFLTPGGPGASWVHGIFNILQLEHTFPGAIALSPENNQIRVCAL